MSDRKNLAAFTERTTEAFPGYASLNQEVDGTITLTVRERGHEGQKTATVTIDRPELVKFLDDGSINLKG